MKTFDVLGVRMSALTLPLATEAILAAARAKRQGYVCVTGVHGIMEAQRDPAVRAILNAAFLNTTDGMPLVWLGRRAIGPWVGESAKEPIVPTCFSPRSTGAPCSAGTARRSPRRWRLGRPR